MKTQALITILLLLCTAIFSTEDTGNVPEYERKTWELNQLAERFKAETGFVGEVGHSTNTMRLHTYRGNFSGIYFSSEGDTIAFRQACEMIVEKILPFSPANRMQLSMSRISKSVRGYTTDYIQQVDGYGVEGAGFIMITCDSGRKHFSIGDNTVELPDGVNVQISKEEAFQIARSEFEKSPLCNKDTPPWRHKSLIQFKSRKIGDVQLPYRLKWQIVFPGIVYYIDAETGEWFCEGYVINQQTACEVMGSKFSKDSNFSSLGLQAMKSIEVLNDDHDPYYTNDSGIALLDGYPSEWFQVNYQSDRYSVRTKSNPSCLSYNVFTQTPTGINVVLPDSLYCSTDSIYYAQHTPNILHHIKEQDSVFCSIVESFENCLYPQIVADCDIPVLGLWDPRLGEIQLREGKNSHVIRHEASHYFTFNIMGFHQFFETTNPDVTNPNFAMPYQAMDEAFAEYWLSIGIDSTYHNHGIANDIAGYDVASINQLFYDGSLAINESFYTNYWNRYPLASVWWSLRGSSLFPNSDQGVVGVDTLLVAGLKIVNEEIIPNSSYRYKPRYFYNILMNLVADGSAPNTLNPKQAAIDNAYKSRGFHFTPQVISAGVSNPPDGRDKNMFRIGDPVHVKVTNCPQNTPLTVYIVEDQDYTDGMNISALNTIICQVSGTSDNDGVWYSSTPVMTASAVGDYDILVDIGNNGMLHFAYIGANVRDGFDGLDGSGFTVFDDGIDVVLTLDLSQSMVGECANLQQLTRRFISAMRPGDKINIFGFNEGTPPNWYGGFMNLSPTPAAQLYSITSSNQNSLISSVGVPNAGGNTDLYIPFLYGHYRFGALTERKKGMVLLSDGEHHPTIDPNHPYDSNYSNPHRMYWVSSSINSYYNPRGIECYTMRFGNITSGIQNMGNIASWGHGVAYQVPQLSNMSLIVSRLINRLRGNPPSYENNQSIPPNSNQTLQIVVDDLADNLQTTLIWNTSGNPSANLFTLTSPSGVVYNQPEYFGTSTLKYAIDAPESGVWSANITNNYSTTQTYSIISEVDSDLTVAVEEIPAMYPVDRPLLLKVSVSDYNTPISSATVNAQLKRGEWQLSVALYDDGCHNDGSAGDGLYGNYLYAYAEIVNVFPSYQQFGDFDLSIIVDIPSINGRRVVNQNLYFSPAQPNSYPQVTRNLHKGWNWIGYPRLQRDEIGSSIDYANASLSPFLTDIVSSYGRAEYRNNQWSYYGLSELKSELGYKLRINDTTSVRLFELGTVIDTLMAHRLFAGHLNWVTYPCYEKVYPWEALSGVIDMIDYIMAEDWSMNKDGDVWIYDGHTRPHLKYGDSIIIRTVSDCEFVWNRPLSTPIIVDPRKPSYFVYEDKPDYETIMIESIEGNPDYTEIGVFQDDVCIGARVNETYPIQILAYSTPVEAGGGPLTFMLYTESKGTVSVSPATIHHGNNTANEQILEPERYGFRVLTLKTNDQQTPSVLALHSNYPNPFNPSTTINFSLPKTAPVKLVIYNIRGQKVKVLLNESLECGNHSIVWNGRDDGNRPVASGVYFARLEQSGVTKISKMMLMK